MRVRSAAHTRVPNQLFDLVLPRLSASEQACLLYVMRRTYGFSGEQRKEWDRISLSQFAQGTQAGEFCLDLGTGLARSSVIRALLQLEERGLVRVSFECPVESVRGQIRGCGWREGDETGLNATDSGASMRCPRCRRTLSKAYSMRTLTPGFVRRFLTATDQSGRVWQYHPELERFYVHTETDLIEVETGPSLDDLRAQSQHEDLLDQIVEQARQFNKTGTISDSRLKNGFYKPLLQLQDEFEPDTVRYALEQVIKRRIVTSGNKQGWLPYAKACAVGHVSRRHGSRQAIDNARTRESIATILVECAELNRQGDRAAARQLLDELVQARLDEVAEVVGDRDRAKAGLFEAFKRGVDDYEDPYAYAASVDYLPEWTSGR